MLIRIIQKSSCTCSPSLLKLIHARSAFHLLPFTTNIWEAVPLTCFFPLTSVEKQTDIFLSSATNCSFSVFYVFVPLNAASDCAPPAYFILLTTAVLLQQERLRLGNLWIKKLSWTFKPQRWSQYAAFFSLPKKLLTPWTESLTTSKWGVSQVYPTNNNKHHPWKCVDTRLLWNYPHALPHPDSCIQAVTAEGSPPCFMRGMALWWHTEEKKFKVWRY